MDEQPINKNALSRISTAYWLKKYF